MTFLNLILLGGAAAFSIPLIIHLFNRRRPRVVEWGAMHLLENVIRKHQRKMRLEQWLLLAIRIALPVVLALLMARPVLTGMQRFFGEQPISTVILLDDSYAMQAGDAAGSRFERARAEVRRMVEQMPKGSDVSIVPLAGDGSALDGPRRAGVADALEELRPLGHSVEAAAALRRAGEEFDRMDHGARELIVVSGFPASVWQPQGGAGVVAAAAGLAELDPAPALTLMPVTAGGEQGLTVGQVAMSSLIVGAGEQVVLRAQVTNQGSTRRTDVPVSLIVNDQQVESQQLDLEPGQMMQVLFRHRFDQSGDQRVRLELEGDAVMADNRFHLVMPVWDEVPVVVVDGAPGRRALEGDADFLEVALQPLRSADPDLNDLIRSRVVTADEFDGELLAGGARVVVLANVKRLNRAQVEALEGFVEGGGGLIVFPGDRVDRNFYNGRLFREGEGLLPVALGEVAEPGGGSGATADAMRMETRASGHPALEYFNEPGNGRLSDALFRRWHRLGQPGDDAEVFARLENGDGLLAERAWGGGRVVMAAFPADNDWGNLPSQPFYVPLMQRLVTHAAVDAAATGDLLTGTPLRAVFPAAVAGRTVVVVDPEGREHVVEAREVGDRAVIEYGDTRLPGIYRVLPPLVEGLAEGESGERSFAFNVARDESDPAPLTGRELEVLAAGMGAELVSSAVDHSELDRTRRFGREIWQPLLWLMLALLFGELLLQQWMGRRRVATA